MIKIVYFFKKKSIKNDFYENFLKVSSYFNYCLKFHYPKKIITNRCMLKMTFNDKIFKPIFFYKKVNKNCNTMFFFLIKKNYNK